MADVRGVGAEGAGKTVEEPHEARSLLCVGTGSGTGTVETIPMSK